MKIRWLKRQIFQRTFTTILVISSDDSTDIEPWLARQGYEMRIIIVDGGMLSDGTGLNTRKYYLYGPENSRIGTYSIAKGGVITFNRSVGNDQERASWERFVAMLSMQSDRIEDIHIDS